MAAGSLGRPPSARGRVPEQEQGRPQCAWLPLPHAADLVAGEREKPPPRGACCARGRERGGGGEVGAARAQRVVSVACRPNPSFRSLQEALVAVADGKTTRRARRTWPRSRPGHGVWGPRKGGTFVSCERPVGVVYGGFWSGRPARSALGLDELPPLLPVFSHFSFPMYILLPIVFSAKLWYKLIFFLVCWGRR